MAWCALPVCVKKTFVHMLYPECCMLAMQRCSASRSKRKGLGCNLLRLAALKAASAQCEFLQEFDEGTPIVAHFRAIELDPAQDEEGASFTVAEGDFVEVDAGEIDQGGRKHSWIIQVLELFEDVQVSFVVAVHLACLHAALGATVLC